MSTVYIQGQSKAKINNHLKLKKKLSTIEYGKTERHALLDEYPSGTQIKVFTYLDSERMPIVIAYGTFNKDENTIV
jgi:hypothetical protein